VQRYIIRRLLWAIPTFLGAVTIIFLLMKVLPGDVAMVILGAESGEVDPEQLAILREQLGLNLPLYQQYFSWLGDLFRMDLGTSLWTGQPVISEILHRLPQDSLEMIRMTDYTRNVLFPSKEVEDEEVEFIPEEKKIQVRLKDGNTLDVEKLSGGAYDQLYLSIRLALGEKLLKGTQGFFIMDDPFIKADRERLERQLDILKKICEIGWQIIYFTAKDEVVELLKADIEEGRVNYIELQDIFA